MSQTKYKLPKNLRLLCICIVRDHKRRSELYQQNRADILYGSPTLSNGQPKGNPHSDTAFSKAEQLEALENSIDTVAMRAVEQAELLVGMDIKDSQEKEKLKQAIYDSAVLGRNFYFNHYDLTIEKSSFYERKRNFLYNIACNMGFKW